VPAGHLSEHFIVPAAASYSTTCPFLHLLTAVKSTFFFCLSSFFYLFLVVFAVNVFFTGFNLSPKSSLDFFIHPSAFLVKSLQNVLAPSIAAFLLAFFVASVSSSTLAVPLLTASH